MSELIVLILEKISSYNILNYFLPGSLLCIILKYFGIVNILIGTDIENIFICYFVGMVVSRIGSILIEGVLKKTKFLDFVPYDKFIEAEQKDVKGKVTILGGINNSFRSYTAVFFIVLMLKFFKHLHFINYSSTDCFQIFLLVALFILFVVSYKKQTDFVRKRVETLCQNNAAEVIEND